MKTTEILTIESLEDIIKSIQAIENELKKFNSNKPCIEDWLTTEAVSKAIKKTPRTLHSWRKKVPTPIPFSQIDDNILYRASDVQKYLMSGYVGNTTGGTGDE